MSLPFLLLGLVFGSGPVLGCDWDLSTDPNQDLDPSFPVVLLVPWAEFSEPESCRLACCARSDCDLALVKQSADGATQCQMVSCVSEVCALKPSSQVQVFRKSVQTESGEPRPTDGNTLRVVPLLDLPEPRSNETNNVLCRLPVKVGPCRAAFPRFFYNVTDQTCSSFIYGGCDANSNNFLSQQECENACSGVTGSVLPDDSTPAPPQPAAVKAVRMVPADSAPLQSTEHCEAEPKAGPCRAALTRWFFNKKMGSCQTFTYGGCRGNKNNYESEESCRVTCAGVAVLPSSKETLDENKGPVDNKELCTLSPDPGMCKAIEHRFYYDPDSAFCKRFVYGGCGGNANNFQSLEECIRSCGSDGTFGQAKTRGRWTAAFFLFVSLAVICVLLLATLVIITLRRHRLTRSLSTASDKQELLPELDDMSSLDSLTVHETSKPEPKA